MATPLAERAKRVTLKTLPVYLALGVLIGMARFAPFWFAGGLVLVVAGEALRVWAAGHLKKTKEVTTTGPYAYVKNPLYLGTFLIMVGFCFMAANFWLLAAGIGIFLIYYAPFKKKREGDRLREHFGPAWDAYDQAVPDYIPRLTPYEQRGQRQWAAEQFAENSEGPTLVMVVLGVVVLALKFGLGFG
jgi:protein-S-isoprenylcysteine O-methyltransferase Ste14